jgi:hypothetical protein
MELPEDGLSKPFSLVLGWNCGITPVVNVCKSLFAINISALSYAFNAQVCWHRPFIGSFWLPIEWEEESKSRFEVMPHPCPRSFFPMICQFVNINCRFCSSWRSVWRG